MFLLLSCLFFFIFLILAIYTISAKRNSKDSTNSSPLSTFSSSQVTGTYDVFLSFRGKDTRKGFVSNLYRALVQRGIHTFHDDERLERGKPVAPELLKAIDDSKIAVVVFSKNYASSSWCLDELVKIMECKGKTVIPVFFYVDPCEIRWQKNCVAAALLKHQKRSRDKLHKWREALRSAASIAGWEVSNTANGDESMCIQKIVETVFRELNSSIINSRKDMVGLGCRMDKVISLLRMESDDVRIIGIWGMGGAGKTTIASAVFRQLTHSYDESCFLEDIGECSKKNGLKYLQETLLSKILNLKYVDISNVDMGIDLLKSRLRFKRVLAVLDNVDHYSQLKALPLDHTSLGRGSRVIITTRNKQILQGVDGIYDMELLNKDEAMQLFSWCAFRKTTPDDDFVLKSHHVIDYAGGLPLALEVLGSHLRGLDLNEWSSAIRRLEKIPEDDIVTKLKISYDGLRDIEQRIFLDVACFFEGLEKDEVNSILESFDFEPEIGLCVLIKKCLLTVDRDKIKMHPLIQEMGRAVVRKDHPDSRLWTEEEVLRVLNGYKGSEAVEVISLSFSKVMDFEISFEHLKTMSKLRLLKFDNVRCLSGPEYLPNELRWLHWDRYPSRSLPTNFEGRQLVMLRMQHSLIDRPFGRKMMLNKLRIMNFNFSQELRQSPDFSWVPCLEELYLNMCKNLKEIHSSFGHHKKLKMVQLAYCENLSVLPTNIQMESLETLLMYGCTKVKSFPEFQGETNCLRVLFLDDTAIRELPSSIKHLTGLTDLLLCDCERLVRLPDSLCRLQNLNRLDIRGCSNLVNDQVHRIFTMPSFRVRYLYLQNCNLSQLVIPENCCLSSLVCLDLSDNNLQSLEIPQNCMPSLQVLRLAGNMFIHVPRRINSLLQLSELHLERCNKLKCIQHLPPNLKSLHIDDCDELTSIPNLLHLCSGLEYVSTARFSEQPVLEAMPGVRINTQRIASVH